MQTGASNDVVTACSSVPGLPYTEGLLWSNRPVLDRTSFPPRDLCHNPTKLVLSFDQPY